MSKQQIQVVSDTEKIKRCEAIQEFFGISKPVTKRELLELTKEERAELARLCARELDVELE